MSQEQEKIESILYEALGKTDVEERKAYLEKACGTNTKLRAEIDSLLLAYEDEKGILKTPPDLLKGPFSTPTEGSGTVIGRYKLLEKIGEGGMAVVYMAEQQEPISRKVALKIIKLGMDTKQVIGRFEAERQALALLDHPNIAKVLDAGATNTGRPYFVMELVKGVSITEYCDQNNLNTKERLELFIQVCNAVQHAHTKGIIHRDIKPSNIMVTMHDGKATVKVIDFGIAKAVNQRLTEKTLFTRYAHIIGTPAYMSPEQAQMSDTDIDIRTDIYSLGVLLYELLTGTTPFSEEELRKAGYLEMQRVIIEQEPVKPSTKLTTLGETLTNIAKHRSSTPNLLKKTVRGDLDWIVMKTLEKNRIRRYEAADGLAHDIQRHLEHRPVTAHAPSRGYRLNKFIRRHRSSAIAVAAIVLIACVVAITISIFDSNQKSEAIRQANILTQARNLIGNNNYTTARKILRPLIKSKHVGLEARNLYAKTIVDGHDPDGIDKDIEALMEKDYRDRIQYYTEIISANREDPNNYLKRAQQYYFLGNVDMVNDDMSQYASIVTNGAFTGFRLSMPKNLGPVINTSIHEPLLWLSDDGLSLWFQRTASNSSSNCETFVAKRATKDAPWGTPESLGIGDDMNSKSMNNSGITTQTFNLNPDVDLASIFKNVGVVPGITTSDGREIYFSKYSVNDEYASFDLWMMRQEAIGADWDKPEPLESINTQAGEVSPTILPDGKELYFGSTASAIRSGSFGLSDIWVSKRTTDGQWGEPKNLEIVNTKYRDHYPVLSGNGLLLFFYSDRPDGYGQRDLYVTKRKSTDDDEWCPPVNLGPLVNCAGFDVGVYMSADGSTIFFNSNRPGGYGGQDIWMVQILNSESDIDPNNNTLSIEKLQEYFN
ncbi:MAG: serine/threonine-protein kinase [Sedimentisphaerales bacterium]|nr:serine/threonine-protein kinase [Sedimentisphaerales bacterium]